MITARDADSALPVGVRAGAVSHAPNAVAEALLLLLPLAYSAVVYFPVTRNYFFADDFLHLYRIRNESFLSYLLVPRGGHLLLTNNALFYGLYRLFGTHAEAYYWVALLTHLLNVALLFWVIRLFTDSGRLACFGATLWGVSPMNEAALGWFSVFGQVLVATIMLYLLVQLGRIAAGRPLRRYDPLLWSVLLLAACTSFGIGIGLTLVFPLVAFLLLPPSPTRTRTVLVFCVLAVLVPALYFGLTRLTTWLYQPRTAPLFYSTNVVANLLMLAQITACGIATLIVGQLAPDLDYASPAALAVVALVVGAVVAALVMAPGPTRRRLLVCIVLCLGCYGIIVVGRAAFFAAAGRSQAFIRPGRYHYAAPIPIAIALCVLLAALDRRYPLRAEIKNRLLGAWLLFTAFAYSQFGRPVNNHVFARRETDAVLTAVRQAVDAAGPGENVYIPHKPFQSLGPIFVKRQDIFPGWAGVFVIFHPDNVVDGKPVFFVTSDPKLRAAMTEGLRTKTLFVEPPQGAAPP